jgi:hypothetical protein
MMSIQMPTNLPNSPSLPPAIVRRREHQAWGRDILQQTAPSILTPTESKHPKAETAGPHHQEVAREALKRFDAQLSDIPTAEDAAGMSITANARMVAKALLSGTENKGFLPDGDLYPDSEGGLRVEWEFDRREVRLIVHAHELGENYIYWQDGEEYNIVTPISVNILSGRLRWLNTTTE